MGRAGGVLREAGQGPGGRWWRAADDRDDFQHAERQGGNLCGRRVLRKVREGSPAGAAQRDHC
eukprot:14179770-Heterocapsa_arctica.AAC.1